MTGSALSPPDRATRRRIALALMVAVSLLVGVAALVFDVEDDGIDPTVADVVLVGAASAALSLCWRAPVAVLAAVVALRLALLATSGSEIALIPAVGFAFYVVGQVIDRRRALALAVVSVVASVTLVMTGSDGESLGEELPSEAGVALLPAALGDAARSRRDRVEALVEAEAEARVQAERLRIARDLHDVVAHSLATIAVQSGVAAHNLGDTDPDDPVRSALERINATGKRSLEELRVMVGVLRSTDDAPLRPTPSDPDDFGDLADAASSVGIPLTLDQRGGFPDHASEAAIVAVHRIAQEALTNVARHAGPVPVTIDVRHREDHVEIRIVNATSGQGSAADSTGVGIIGMRERAESLGGTVEATTLPGGGFDVQATLPYAPRRPDRPDRSPSPAPSPPSGPSP